MGELHWRRHSVERVVVMGVLAALMSTTLFGCGRSHVRAANQQGLGKAHGARVLPRDCELPKTGRPTLADANVGFGLRTFRRIDQARKGHNSNTTYSPYSASTALQMLVNGADPGTDRELLNALCVKDTSLAQLNQQAHGLRAALVDSGNGVQLQVANSIWTAPGQVPRPQVVRTVQSSFEGDIRQFQFNQAEPVNDWISRQTKGRIPKLLKNSDLGPDMVMLLINALAFDGSWSKRFDKATPGTFHSTTGDLKVPTLRDGERTVAFMSTWSRFDSSHKATDDDFDAARIPYGKSGRFGLVVVVPARRNGLDAVIRRLGPNGWRSMEQKLRPESVNIEMPKLHTEQTNDLTKQMFVAGIPKNTYNRLVTNDSLMPKVIEFIKQGTFLDIDEHGTKAAAATVIGIVMTSAHVTQPLVADHPYLLALEDTKTHTLLMVDAIRNPV